MAFCLVNRISSWQATIIGYRKELNEQMQIYKQIAKIKNITTRISIY